MITKREGPNTPKSKSEEGERFIPYGRQWLDDEDIQSVVAILRSDWLTTGPTVQRFEEAFAEFVGAKHAVAVSNGTAALHSSIYAAAIGPGDEVIVPTMTFAASANCALYQGAYPIFADVEPDTLLLGPAQIEERITSRTKAVVAVDYAGQPCDYDAIKEVTSRHDLLLIDDACHAIGGAYKNRNVGTLADLNTFSFHPVKHITSGEGGAVTTDDAQMAQRLRNFRNHGITTDHHDREKLGSWFYEMTDLGYNYRLTDFQCALAMSQLGKLRNWVKRRREIARRYDEAFAELQCVKPLYTRADVVHAYHLYIVRLNLDRLDIDRARAFKHLRSIGLGVNVHYIPIHLHPYYRRHFGTTLGLCPIAEAAYQQILTLPLFPSMSEDDIQRVINAIFGIEENFGR